MTIETLRHYDAIGLLKPAKTDPYTGYRYYNAGQLETLNHILALKDSGLSLEEINRIFKENLTIDEVRGILKAQLVMTESAIEEAQHRRQDLLMRLQNLDLENQMPEYEVSLKSTPAMTIASIRERIATPEHIPQRWNELFTAVAAWLNSSDLPIGIPISFYHDEGYRVSDIDTECAFTIPLKSVEQIPEPPMPIIVQEIAAMPKVASVIVANFHMKFNGLKSAYIALGQWIAQHNYHIVAAPRELYYGSPSAGDYVAEIQFPVDSPS